MTVFECPLTPHFSVQKARKERRENRGTWDPQDSQDQQARRARKGRRAMEASKDCQESQDEMAGQERSVSLDPKGRKETQALLGLRDWQESLGHLASLDHLG